MRTLTLTVAVALVTLAFVPAAQAQDIGIKNPNTSTPTTLFFHLLNIQDFPINTQVPSDDWTEEPTWGATTNTLTCVGNQAQQNTGGIQQEYHTYRGYSSPSYVEYDFIQNGEPRTHPERGISYDAIFDQNAPFTVYWYLRTASGAGGAEQVDNTAPIPISNVVVKATIRAGDAISIDDKAYDSGPLIAEGQTIPATLLGSAQPVQQSPPNTGEHKQVKYVGDATVGNVYEFAIPMDFATDKIPRATGYNIRIDAFIDNPNCNNPAETGSIMPNVANPFSGPERRPRMELAINNPIRLEYLHPQFVGDDLVVHTSMNSAWGNYDVHEETIKVEITGPSAAPSLARAAIVQRTHEHYHHQEAVDVTYVWPYKVDRASNGLYTVKVEFQNDQGTATALGSAQFEIGKGIVIGCGGIQESAQKLSDDCAKDIQKDGAAPAEKSPGFGLVALLGALAAAFVALRRRQA